MAPKVNRTLDQYALGVLLFRMITLSMPFEHVHWSVHPSYIHVHKEEWSTCKILLQYNMDRIFMVFWNKRNMQFMSEDQPFMADFRPYVRQLLDKSWDTRQNGFDGLLKMLQHPDSTESQGHQERK